jgi:phage N-6-adenine-methyltransferase
MGMNKGLYSSNTYEWETPQAFFDQLNQEFEFELDVCATKENAKCSNFYSIWEDGLKQEWKGICWMNPPYGRVIKKWVKKAYESSVKGATVVCLLPARTDTIWWHEYCEQANKNDIRFIKGRLRFGESKKDAPFPSVIVIFRGKV